MIEWIQNKGRGSTAKTQYVAVSVTKSGTRSKSQNAKPHSLVVRFSSEAQKDLRLISGDRLIVGLDQVTKQVCIKRVSENGYVLSGSSANAKRGSVLCVQLATDLPWHAAINVSKDGVHIEGTHTAIDTPELFAK